MDLFFCPKADAKVQLIPETTKLLDVFFRKKTTFFGTLDKNQPKRERTHYIYYAREGKKEKKHGRGDTEATEGREGRTEKRRTRRQGKADKMRQQGKADKKITKRRVIRKN